MYQQQTEPDPLRVFAASLRKLRRDAGSPSLRFLAGRIQRHAAPSGGPSPKGLGKSSIDDKLRGDSAPSPEFVLLFVDACAAWGRSHGHLLPDSRVDRVDWQDLRYVLTRLNQIMHGWANYFRHAVAKHTFSTLDTFTWRRLINMLMRRHHWNWTAIRRRFTTPTGRWQPITADGIEHQPIAAIPVTRYRWRGTTIPNPWPATTNA